MTALSVNVNTVALLRNSRTLDIPEVAHVAELALAAVALEYFIGTPFARTLGLRKAPMLFGFVIMLKKPALIHSAVLYFVLIYLLPIGAVARLSADRSRRTAT